MDVMSMGVITYDVLGASREGLFTPIISRVKDVAYADPVPHPPCIPPIGGGGGDDCNRHWLFDSSFDASGCDEVSKGSFHSRN